MAESETLYLVGASQLNLRAAPGVEGRVVAVLPRGDAVVVTGQSEVPGWAAVMVQKTGKAGYVARQYIQPAAGTLPDMESINQTLWDCTQAAAGKIGYLLGARSSASGRIDCSGWVCEITRKAFAAVNAAAAPAVVFHTADMNALATHSDGIICAVQRRTGFILHGAAVTAAALRPGMLIGINFADYSWEHDTPPRVYGIDHIVQLVADPASRVLYITQSSSSGHGVNLVKLDAWLAERVHQGLMTAGRIHAVDPLRLADVHALAPAPVSPGPVSPVAPPGPDRLAAFRGRGFYLESVAGVLKQLVSIPAAISEMQRCRTHHVWVRIHGRGYVGESRAADIDQQKSFIAAAQGAGIQVAGWGWCQGEDPVAEAQLALRALETFGLNAYVADIEQGVNGAQWTKPEVRTFFDTVRAGFAGGIAATSHGFIDYHSPELFRGLTDVIDAVNPQAYWFDGTPGAKMLAAVGASRTDYPLDNPASYARLCADRWALYGLPVILSGQAYAEGDFTLADAASQLTRFATDMPSSLPAAVIGVNLYHLGAMDRTLRDIWAGAAIL